jgi:mannose-6-phosphate isomerase class I
MERLDCHVKEYAWGKRGSTSEVARLFAAGHKHFFQIDPKTPYAEVSLVDKREDICFFFSFGWELIR